MDDRPIGFFDSGIGGLTILRAAMRLLPREHTIYLADSAHFPYGQIAPDELRAITARLTAFLLGRDCKLIVVACNTATVHSLAYLRDTFPQVPFVGVVPVVKVLAERTRTGAIALLSTPTTASSPYLTDLIARFAPACTVVNVACEGLAEAIERDDADDPNLQALLARYLAPVRASAADVLGLGCTHYPFLTEQIRRILGPGVRIYDSSRPVAQRVRAVLAERDALAATHPTHHFYTTGDPTALGRAGRQLLCLPDVEIEPVTLGPRYG